MNIYSIIFFGAVNGCSVVVDGQTYDLDPLEALGNISVTPPADEVGEYSYSVSFCSNQVPCGSFIVANMVRYGAYCETYARWGSVENKKTVNGYEADFTGLMQCDDNFNVYFTAQFNLLCDPGAGTLGTLQAIKTGSDDCNYAVDIHTDLVCEGSVPIGGGGGEQSLSAGSIFLITLLLLIVVYLIVGFVLNYVKEKAVKAPHKAFWCGKLPYWTKTGCITTWLCTMSSYHWCCKKILETKPHDDKMATGLIVMARTTNTLKNDSNSAIGLSAVY